MPEAVSRYGAKLRGSAPLKRAMCFLVAAFAIVAPYFLSLPASWRLAQGTIAESSTFSLNRPLYFWDLVHLRSFFEEGQRSVWLLQYAAWYFLQSAAHLVMPDAAAYVFLVGCFFLFGAWFFVKLVTFIATRDDEPVTIAGWAFACLLAVLYFSSLSFYNFLQNNIFFALPYLILPALLYWSLRYTYKGDTIALLPFTLCALLLSDLNIFHDIIIACFVNVMLIVMWRRGAVAGVVLAGRAAMVNLALAPGILWLLTATAGHATYLGQLSDFAKVSAEGMYSSNTGYLNIFLQQTDWGLFQSWNGQPYYYFAYAYTDPRFWAFGFAPFVMLSVAGLLSRADRSRRVVAAWLTGCAIILFATMFGTNNVVYRLLYTHIVAFQIFRNITKLAPLLYLCVLIAAYVLLYSRLRERIVAGVVWALVAIALVYNLPYWTYGAKTFDIRTIQSVPAYWRAAADYLTLNTRPNSKILVLPATYIYEQYNWDYGRVAVQGDLLDVLLHKAESYRLSERLVGSVYMQEDENESFVPSNRSIRNLDTDYNRLTELVGKYGFDYAVLTNDTVSEYQHTNDILRWLSVNHFQLVAQYGPVEIFHNSEYRQALFSGADSEFQRVNPLRFEAVLHNFNGTRKITLGVPYNSGWALEVEPYRPLACQPKVTSGSEGYRVTQCSDDGSGGSVLQEIEALRRPAEYGKSHRMTPQATNVWTLRSADIVRDHPEWYRRGERGRPIDVRIGLYFRPQAYTYIGAIAAAASFVVLFLIELVMVVSRRSIAPVRRIAATGASFIAVVAAGAFAFTMVRTGQPQSIASSPAAISPAGKYVRMLTTDPPSTIRFTWAGPRDESIDITGCDGARRALHLALSKHGNLIDLRIHPTALVRCTLTLEALSPVTRSAVSSAYVYVDAAPPIAAGGGATTSESLVFASPNAAAQQVNIVGGPYGEWFYLERASDCNGVATAGLDQRPQGSLSDISADVVVRPVRAGLCRFYVRQTGDPRGEVAVSVRVMGPLSLSSGSEQTIAHFVFNGRHSGPRALDVFKPFSDSPLSLGVYGGDCADVAGIYPGPPTSGARGAAGRIVIDPVSPGNCTALIGDQYGLSGSTITVHITVLPLSVRRVSLHS